MQLFISAYNRSSQKPQLLWLILSCFFIVLMVSVGGITRLTESGLSIVRWEPISGTIPPLSEESWNKEFTLYKESPQYKKINRGMSLSEFKGIFFWEWLHRFLGRFIGLVFFIPYLYFLIRKKLSSKLIKNGFFIFTLGGLQGFMGWYMVKSGLVNHPEVSHYRLAAHLLLAFIIIAYIFYIFLETLFSESRKSLSAVDLKWSGILSQLLFLFSTVLFIQITYGAFLAKLKGGLYYNTFPMMGNYWVPPEVFIFTPWILDLFENPVTVQLIHRVCAYLLFILGVLTTSLVYFKLKDNYFLRFTAAVWMSVLLLQFLLGVFTLLMALPITLAVLHQVGGCLLVLCTTAIVFGLKTTKVEQI